MNGSTLTLMSLNKEEFLANLRSWGLIPHEVKCEKCGQPMSLNNRANVPDGYQYRCHNVIVKPKRKRVRCGKRMSFRAGTFFGKSQLTILQILLFVNSWVLNSTLKTVGVQSGIKSDKTLMNWASFCREVLWEALIKNPVKIGGPDRVVEIKESKFGKRKYHRGYRVEGQWVFGGFERKTGRIFVVPVDRRDKDTLLPIIREWIEDGTTIISDCWKAYDCLESEGFRHLKVNHSMNFKDPVSDAHTNAIESSWKHEKKVATSYGRKKEHVAGNLARYMFFKRCDGLKLDRTIEFFRLAGQLYDPNKPRENDSGILESPQSDDEWDDLAE